jgi:hypothetical protein
MNKHWKSRQIDFGVIVSSVELHMVLHYTISDRDDFTRQA